jgi:hypothetical protein
MKILSRVMWVFVIIILLTGTIHLYAQDLDVTTLPLSAEAINLRDYPVQFDDEMGVSIARIGEGRLFQMDAALIEIPPNDWAEGDLLSPSMNDWHQHVNTSTEGAGRDSGTGI